MFPSFLLRLRCAGICGMAFGVAALSAKPIILVSPAVVPVSSSPAPAADTWGNTRIDEAQFQSAPSPLPAEIAHLGFEATATNEFGDLIRLEGAAHFPGEISIVLSNDATHSLFPNASPIGFTHPITLTLYAVDRTSGTAQPGQPLASFSDNILVPWRSERVNAAGLLPTSRAFTVKFHVGGSGLSLPDEVIFGVSFNTQHYGRAPLGVPGPYDFLGVGVVDRVASVGANLEPDVVFWNTTNSFNYSDAGAMGSGWLRRDNGWVAYQPAARVTNSVYGLLSNLAARLDALSRANPLNAAALSSATALLQLALDREQWDGNQQLHPLYGQNAFDLLVGAAEELAKAITQNPAIAADLRAALGVLTTASEVLANSAVSDALAFGGSAQGIINAEDKLDAADDYRFEARFSSAIGAFGAAWLEAQAALY